MSKQEILEKLKELSPAERLIVIESALQELRGEMQRSSTMPDSEDKRRQLAAAAQALYADYASDSELTAFSVLDCEDFHA